MGWVVGSVTGTHTLPRLRFFCFCFCFFCFCFCFCFRLGRAAGAFWFIAFLIAGVSAESAAERPRTALFRLLRMTARA